MILAIDCLRKAAFLLVFREPFDIRNSIFSIFLCSLPLALCSLLFALCPSPLALGSLPFALACLVRLPSFGRMTRALGLFLLITLALALRPSIFDIQYFLCPLPFALRPSPFAPCPWLLALSCCLLLLLLSICLTLSSLFPYPKSGFFPIVRTIH